MNNRALIRSPNDEYWYIIETDTRQPMVDVPRYDNNVRVDVLELNALDTAIDNNSEGVSVLASCLQTRKVLDYIIGMGRQEDA